MRPLIQLGSRFFVRRLLSLRNGVFLLLVVAVLLAGVVGLESTRRSLQDLVAGRATETGEPWVSAAEELWPGSAHLNVWEAVSSRMLMSEAGLGGPLYPLRTVAPLLAFVLLLAAFVSSYDTVSRDLETRRLDALLTLPVKRHAIGLSRAIGEALALTVTLAAAFVIAMWAATGLIDLEWTGTQLARAAVFLAVLGAYVFLFVLIGTWISLRARSSKRALWAAAIVFVAVLVSHTVGESLMAIDASALPALPEVPTEVTTYLRTSAFRVGADTAEPPEVVQEYVAALDGYLIDLSETLRARYRHERWWNLVSMPALLLEVAGRLLQDQYADVLDVFYSSARPERRSASLAASFGQSAWEIAWLVLLCCGAFALNVRSLTRLEV